MEKFVFLIFHTSHDTNVCKVIFHDVDDFEYAPRITETTYLSLAMYVDTKTSRQLLICNMEHLFFFFFFFFFANCKLNLFSQEFHNQYVQQITSYLFN